MKTFKIQVQSKAEADREFIDAFKNARAGKKSPAKIGVYFTSLEAVRNLLTERRLELLHAVREKHPHSIYQLARLTGRNFRNVYDDVQILKTYGLIHLGKLPKKRQRSNRSLSVPYREINIHAWI